MLVRLVAADPQPSDDAKNDDNDLLVYHVPEHSRQLELLLELFGDAGIECVVIESNKKRRKKR